MNTTFKHCAFLTLSALFLGILSAKHDSLLLPAALSLLAARYAVWLSLSGVRRIVISVVVAAMLLGSTDLGPGLLAVLLIMELVAFFVGDPANFRMSFPDERNGHQSQRHTGHARRRNAAGHGIFFDPEMDAVHKMPYAISTGPYFPDDGFNNGMSGPIHNV